MAKRLTPDEWLVRARAKHGDKYDYSKSIYINKATKITIICPKHGEFQQRAGDHLRYDCKKCGVERRANSQRFSRADWLARAKEAHGDKKFDYSLVPENVSGNDRVDIICEKGHKWNAIFQSHCYGRGCMECYREVQGQNFRYSQEEWIAKAKAKHGDYYDYSKVIYVGSYDPVTITCKYHGDFSQLPTSHLSGKACPDCGHKRSGQKGRLTQEQFLYKARQMHGNYYDLSKAKYTKGDELIEIICPIHGSYQQKAINFLTGRGCESCGRHRGAAVRRTTQEEFISKAKQIHGDKYDYSKTVYQTTRDNITIICPKHGEFTIQANEHTNAGRGCKYCSRSEVHPDDFIEDCRKVHGDKYDYSKVEYKGYHEYITVICPKHGEWRTMAGVFLRADCPSCAKYGFNTQLPASAYLIKYETPEFVAYKQGITNQKISERMVALRRSITEQYPDAQIELVDSIEYEIGQHARDLEIKLQSIENIRFIPPIKFDGYTEMYSEGILEHWQKVK